MKCLKNTQAKETTNCTDVNHSYVRIPHDPWNSRSELEALGTWGQIGASRVVGFLLTFYVKPCSSSPWSADHTCGIYSNFPRCATDLIVSSHNNATIDLYLKVRFCVIMILNIDKNEQANCAVYDIVELRIAVVVYLSH